MLKCYSALQIYFDEAAEVQCDPGASGIYKALTDTRYTCKLILNSLQYYLSLLRFTLTLNALGDILSTLKVLNQNLQKTDLSPLGAQTLVFAASSKFSDHYLDQEVHWEARMEESIKELKPTVEIISLDIISFVRK